MLTCLFSNSPTNARIIGNLSFLAVVLLAAIASSAYAASSPPADLFVSPDGSDGYSGTRQRPFRALEQARGRIRALKDANQLPAGGLTVWLREGVYHREQTFELTEQDSGTADGPIVYRA